MPAIQYVQNNGVLVVYRTFDEGAGVARVVASGM